MDTSKKHYETIDAYIHTFPKEIQAILQTLRKTIQEESPDAVEAIRYQMPTFRLNGKNLVHFAAWKNHIGFYPTPSGTESFQKELVSYVVTKGAIQFPLEQPMPLPLIRKIVAFRVKENLKNA
jgi:uncharacterized protein YdhG (YjbR/CyaY superfamily)